MHHRKAGWLATACLVMAGTVDAASNVVQISYDAAGNIIAIERVHVAPSALTGSNPATGAPGPIALTEGAAAPTAIATTIDMSGKSLAHVNAPRRSTSTPNSQLVVR